MSVSLVKRIAPFVPDTAMARQRAVGHRMRKGHELTGYYTPTADRGIVRLVLTCCPTTD